MTGTTIAVVLGASLLGAFVKAVTGMGYPVIAIPLITLVLGIEDAVTIVALPNLAANIALCVGARDGRAEARDIKPLLLWGIGGAVIGTFALVRVPETPLLILLVLTVGVFVINYLRSPDLLIDPVTSRRWSPVVGGAAGIMQGAVGVSGPIIAGWLHGYRLSARSYVFSVTAIFAASGATQLLVLAGTKIYTADILAVSVLTLVPVLAMVPVGTSLRDRLDGPAFERAVLSIIAASGVALIIQIIS